MKQGKTKTEWGRTGGLNGCVRNQEQIVAIDACFGKNQGEHKQRSEGGVRVDVGPAKRCPGHQEQVAAIDDCVGIREVAVEGESVVYKARFGPVYQVAGVEEGQAAAVDFARGVGENCQQWGAAAHGS